MIRLSSPKLTQSLLVSLAAEVSRRLLESTEAPAEAREGWGGHSRGAWMLANLFNSTPEWAEDFAAEVFGGIPALLAALNLDTTPRGGWWISVRAHIDPRWPWECLHSYAQFEERAAHDLGISAEEFRGRYVDLGWLLRLVGSITETDPANCPHCWDREHGNRGVVPATIQEAYEAEQARLPEMAMEQHARFFAEFEALAGEAS
jgi:hypothetical protein